MKSIKALAIGVTLALATSTAIQAQERIDMSKFTCQQLASGPMADTVETAVWLSGYFNGLRKNTVVDVKQFHRNAELVIQECAANPKKTVMQTINSMMSAGKKK